MRLAYGFDPLCGWCFGFVPALRAVHAAFPDMPIDVVTPGLVTGDRIGPYAEMEGYIRGASVNLKRVTGRAPSEAFFALIRTEGVIGSSIPPIAALAQVRAQTPEHVLSVAHAMTEAHFLHGADLGKADTYRQIWAALGLSLPVPDLSRSDVAERAMQDAHPFAIRSFPTLMAQASGGWVHMPSNYDPKAVVDWVRRMAQRAG